MTPDTEARLERLAEMTKRVWGPTAQLAFEEEHNIVEVTTECTCGKNCPESTAFFVWHERALDVLAWTMNGLLADKEQQH